MNDRIMISRRELATLVNAAVREAVHDAFKDVGLYAETPAQQEESRQDLAFLRFLRRSRDTIGRSIANALVVIVLSGVAGALWLGFRTKVGQ